MSEEFHPVISKHVETEGLDIGRIKDISLAHAVAKGVNVGIEEVKQDIAEGYDIHGADSEWMNRRTHKALRHELAGMAVNSAMSTLINNLTVIGVEGKTDSSSAIGNPEYMDRAVQQAGLVAQQFDALSAQQPETPRV